MTSRRHEAARASGFLPALAATALVFPCMVGTLGCRRGGDEAAIQARRAEREGRVRLRDGSDIAVCDATLLFARERHLGRSSADARWERRGANLVARWAPECQGSIERFWAAYGGCATPIRGRELETFGYWDQMRIAAFQQYGEAGIAAAMATGRSRWQASCPADYQAVVAQEPAFQAQLPLPVPITAAAPAAPAASAASPDEAQARLFRAVGFMAHGQYQQALTELQAIAAGGATPMVTFNIAVCYDQLGNVEQAVAHYQQVASDPTFGPRAQARIRLLGGETAAPSEEATRTARAEFERGLELAEAGSYQEAIEAFNRSYAAVPHPRTILNIAVSYHRLGEVEAAISHYQLVVDDEQLEEEMRQTAMRAIQELTAAARPAPPSAAAPAE